MIRSSSMSLDLATHTKLNTINAVFDEYTRVVNGLIDQMYQLKFIDKFPVVSTKTWLSARMIQCAAKQAGEIVKSTRKKDREIRLKKYKKIYKYFIERNRQVSFIQKKFSDVSLSYKIKPRFDDKSINLDSRFWKLCTSSTSFDYWVSLTSIGNRIKLYLPIKDHKHNKKFKDWKRIGSCRLLRNNGKYKIELIYEKEASAISKKKSVLALDLGINTLISASNGKQIGNNFKQLLNELSNKEQGSRSYNKKLTQIHQYIRWCVNQLDLQDISDLVLEDLKYIQIGTKERVNKTTIKMLSKWNLGLLHRVFEQKCEENCVYLHYVDPKNTSRTCPKCGSIDKRNRNGELFHCINCGYEANADLNAAMNILARFYQEKTLKVDIVPDSAKANFSDFIEFH